MRDDLLYLYGGDQPWDSTLWVTSDDRVRGGSSTSHLTLVNPELARFHGHLDTTTLGGAGFASQHSLGALDWDLSAYDGLLVVAPRADRMCYAVTLKDDLPGKRPDGRESSGVSWEAVFEGGGGGEDVFLPWAAFRATYRGREKDDADPLDLASVKRVGLMMRSYFGEQSGDFSIDLHAIAARRTVSDDTGAPAAAPSAAQQEDDGEVSLKSPVSQPRASAPWWKKLLCGMV